MERRQVGHTTERQLDPIGGDDMLWTTQGGDGLFNNFVYFRVFQASWYFRVFVLHPGISECLFVTNNTECFFFNIQYRTHLILLQLYYWFYYATSHTFYNTEVAIFYNSILNYFSYYHVLFVVWQGHILRQLTYRHSTIH